MANVRRAASRRRGTTSVSALIPGIEMALSHPLTRTPGPRRQPHLTRPVASLRGRLGAGPATRVSGRPADERVRARQMGTGPARPAVARAFPVAQDLGVEFNSTEARWPDEAAPGLLTVAPMAARSARAVSGVRVVQRDPPFSATQAVASGGSRPSPRSPLVIRMEPCGMATGSEPKFVIECHPPGRQK